MTRGGAMRLITMCFIRIGVRGSLALSLLAVAALRAAPPKQPFTGTITDRMCAKADHSQMQMGPTDAACTMACVTVHGAAYVLYAGTSAYTLHDHRTPEKFAAHK